MKALGGPTARSGHGAAAAQAVSVSSGMRHALYGVPYHSSTRSVVPVKAGSTTITTAAAGVSSRSVSRMRRSSYAAYRLSPVSRCSSGSQCMRGASFRASADGSSRSRYVQYIRLMSAASW